MNDWHDINKRPGGYVQAILSDGVVTSVAYWEKDINIWVTPGAKTICSVGDDGVVSYDTNFHPTKWRESDISMINNDTMDSIVASVIEEQREEVEIRGEELTKPIYWTGKQWAVTAFGLEARDGTYPIEKSRLWESHFEEGWERHMAEKNWVDMEDFREAINYARKKFKDMDPRNIH